MPFKKNPKNLRFGYKNEGKKMGGNRMVEKIYFTGCIATITLTCEFIEKHLYVNKKTPLSLDL